MSTAPVPTRPKNSNVLAWVLGLLGAAAVIFVLGALVVAHYIVKDVRISRDATQVEIRTPAGELSVRKGAVKETGLPVYPGATPLESGAKLDITTPDEEKVGVTVAKYRTSDPLDKVDAWYREHLGREFEREGPGIKVRTVHAQGVSVKSEDVSFVSDKDDLVRVVALRKTLKGLEIALARIGKTEAQ